MPVIKVWCLPKSSEKKLRQLHKAIVEAVCSIKVLGLRSQQDMTVLFPPDSMSFGLGSEIVIEITGLFVRHERTLEVHQTLAFRVGKAVQKLFPKADNIECFVYPFNQNVNGFWGSRDKLSVLDISISELDMRHTQKDRLIEAGITTLGELVRTPRAEVAKIRTFGKQTMYYLALALKRQFDLEFLK